MDHIPFSIRRPALTMSYELITIHSTANLKSTARNERNWLTNPSNNNQASYHIVVDDKELIECIPFNEVAWNAGDGYTGTGNRSSIAIEICESGDRTKTLDNASTLVATLLRQKGWRTNRLRRHFDWSGKICPRILSDNNWEGWNEFISNVEKKMKED